METKVGWDDVEAAVSCGQSLAAFLPREFLVQERDEVASNPCQVRWPTEGRTFGVLTALAIATTGERTMRIIFRIFSLTVAIVVGSERRCHA
jgi:hypothetical protein